VTPRVLIIAEHDGERLNASTAKCVSCARTIAGADITVAVFAKRGSVVAEQAALLEGVARVQRVAADSALAAALAPQVASAASDYTHVLGPSTTFGKDLMPRVAALLGVGQISDVMEVLDAHRFKRPVYAGNAIVTVRASPERKLVATVRTASYPAAAGAAAAAPIEEGAPAHEAPGHSRFVELRSGRADRPDLQTATRVVAGGRALGSAENFTRLYELADALGAAVGASRAAVDSGFVANDLQVGQTGKIIAPELYIAIGISGAIQHLTGIKDARTIVAINRDSDAPIFEVADVGLVGDWTRVLPELLTALRAQAAS
jgi:electron transfer flavoprotein alpha subunit